MLYVKFEISVFVLSVAFQQMSFGWLLVFSGVYNISLLGLLVFGCVAWMNGYS